MIEEPPPLRSTAEQEAAKAAKRVHVTKVTESMTRMTKDDWLIGQLLYPERVEGRPRTRGECAGVPRPCPYVGCRHHLGIEVNGAGNLSFAHGPTEVHDLRWSCSLDLAEHEGLTLDQVGQALGVTRERVRQLEVRALAKAQRAAKRMGLDFPALALLEEKAWPVP